MSNFKTEQIAYMSINGGEPVPVQSVEATIDYDITEVPERNFDFTKEHTFSGTFEISPEFKAWIDKGVKLEKMRKSRERLYRDIERWEDK